MQTVIEREGLGDGMNSGFGRRVAQRRAPFSVQRAHRRKVDDRPAFAMLLHGADAELAAEHHGEQIDRDHVIELYDVDLAGLSAHDGPGVVDDDVDAPELLESGGEGRLDLVFLAHVTVAREGVGTDFRRGIVLLTGDVEQDHLGALPHEDLADLFAEPPAAPGYHRHFSRQHLVRHGVLRCLDPTAAS